MENKKLAMVFGMFLVIILGTSFATIIADRNSEIIDPTFTNNETLNMKEAFNGTGINSSKTFNLSNGDWVDSSVILFNRSGTRLTAGTDYNVDYTLERINFSNTTITMTLVLQAQNNSGVNYSYFGEDYLDDNTQRTLISLIIVFFVIGILMLVYDKFRDGASDLIGR